MSQFYHPSKALARVVFCRNSFRQRITRYSHCNQIRCLSTMAGISAHLSSDKIVGGHMNHNLSGFGNSLSTTSKFLFQKRGMMGCVESEVEKKSSKAHEERRVLGYSPEQLFRVVAAVDLYQEFLPWCKRSEIIRRNRDRTFDAELEIGFKFLSESYMSHVELNAPKCIKTTSTRSRLFDHLINVWEFNPGPVPGTCNLYFLVDFRFRSQFHRQIANVFFEEVVDRVVGSFVERCQLIYGPGLPVLENTCKRRR